MRKLIKYVVFGVIGLVALVLLVAVYFAMTFDPNDYKQEVIDLVKEKSDRTLTIEGDITLAYWPKIGADLGKISISEYQSDETFASINSMKVALAVMPLLKNQVVVDTVYVNGASANIVKHKDGSANFDDLVSKDESVKSKAISFNVEGINITHSAVSYTDEATETQYKVSEFNMASGAIALAEPIDLKTDFMVVANQPAVNAKVALSGNFLADPETKHFVVKSLDSHITGDLAGGTGVDIVASGNVDAKAETMEVIVEGLKLVASGDFDGANNAINVSAPGLKVLNNEVSGKEISLSLVQTKAKDKLKLNMVLANMKGSAKALKSSGITGNIAMVQGARTVSGKFSSPFTGNIEALIFDIPKLAGNLDIKDPSLPNGQVKGLFNIAAHTEVNKELANSQFNLNLDDTNLKGDFNIAGFKKKNIKFNLTADKLDLNKLMGKSAAPATSTDKADNKPADMSALKDMSIDGKVNIGSLTYDQYRVSGLNVGIKANGDKLVLSGFNVKVDDSQIKGSLGMSNFANPLYTFDIDVDQVNLDKYTSADEPTAKQESSDKPLDLSALKALNADGSIRVGSLKYGETKASNVHIKLNTNGQKLSLNPFKAKVDDSQINVSLGITQFSNPAFNFNVRIDKLDADKYITSSDEPAAKNSDDTPIDLSALKKLNATGEANIGWLKLANITSKNVKVGLKANDGLVDVQPFAANLYSGSMNGSLSVDARATPNIRFKQNMKSISIAPLMIDAINNDMLSGSGSVNIDVSTQGTTVKALKKALQGKASLNLSNGALKGIDIAGQIRGIKNKVSSFTGGAIEAASDDDKKTDFSALTASFTIQNGVAHNEDLAMKAPILRLAKGQSAGDIDIGNQTINYTAKPTIVKSIKGQGGKDLDQLAGIPIPIKISGTFDNPKYGLDLKGVAKEIAKGKLLEKVGGTKGVAVKEIISGDNKLDAIKGLLGKKKSIPAATDAGATAAEAPAKKPTNVEDLAKDKLKDMLKF